MAWESRTEDRTLRLENFAVGQRLGLLWPTGENIEYRRLKTLIAGALGPAQEWVAGYACSAGG